MRSAALIFPVVDIHPGPVTTVVAPTSSWARKARTLERRDG
jgi:hypothetical protein